MSKLKSPNKQKDSSALQPSLWALFPAPFWIWDRALAPRLVLLMVPSQTDLSQSFFKAHLSIKFGSHRQLGRSKLMMAQLWLALSCLTEASHPVMNIL